MKTETKLVKVGDTPEDKCPSYLKQTSETFAEAFEILSKAIKVVLTSEVSKAVAELDSHFPAIQDKDGNDIPSPIRESFLGHWNYGFDLYAKATTRRKFEATLEDPSKPVVAALKGMVASGFDAQTAYDLVVAQRESKGLETPSFETISAKLK